MENDVAVISVEETQDVACDIITVHNVRGYIDENGTAWLNAEDVARGLGFVMVRKDRVTGSCDNSSNSETTQFYTAVRWNTVNDYLSGFGYPHKVGKDDFIPENMFYRLAMKAKNETAEKFQAKVADEILPELRKHRFYSLDNNKTQSSVIDPAFVTPSEVVKEIGKTRDSIMDIYGAKNGIALAQATELAEIFYQRDLTGLKKLIPPADHEIGTLTPTEIGKKINLSAQKVNKKLVELGLQVKEDKIFRLTDKGRKYGEVFPFTRNGHTDYQIKWTAMVVKLIHGKEEELPLQ